MIKRTSLRLDMDLVAEASRALQTRGTTETVHRALAEAVRRARLHRLATRTFEITLADYKQLRRPRSPA